MQWTETVFHTPDRHWRVDTTLISPFGKEVPMAVLFQYCVSKNLVNFACNVVLLASHYSF